MLSKPWFYPKAWLWKPALRPGTRTRQDSKLWCRFISWYHRICMQPGTMGLQALLILQKRLIPLCWDVLGPCLVHGEKKHLFHFYQLLKSSCKNVFKNLFSLSFINHMNHQWKDLGKFCDDTKLKEIACSETRHSSAAGHQALLHQEKSLHTPKDGAEMKSSNYLDIAVGNWLAGCFHESFFKSDLPDPQKSKAQLK